MQTRYQFQDKTASIITVDIAALNEQDSSKDPRRFARFVGFLLSRGDYARGSRFISGGATVDMLAFRQWVNAAEVVNTVNLCIHDNDSPQAFPNGWRWGRALVWEPLSSRVGFSVR